MHRRIEVLVAVVFLLACNKGQKPSNDPSTANVTPPGTAPAAPPGGTAPLKTSLERTPDKTAPANLETVLGHCEEGDNKNQPYCRLNCAYREVICLDVSGVPIPSEVVPDALDPRSTFYVYYVTTGDTRTIPDTRVTEVIGKESIDRGLVKGNDADRLIPAGDGFKARAVAFTMASDAETERIDILVPGTQDKLSSLIIRSNGGRYYFSYGPMLAVPLGGTQKIREAIPPNGSAARYERGRDTELVPSFAVHLFPGGHRAHSLGPFDRPRRWHDAIRDLVSIEAAVAIDPRRIFDHVFLGLALEPVTGFTASAGVGFHRGERYWNGFEDGAFIVNPRESAVEEFAQVNCYLGFGVNQKIISTITQAFSSSSSQKSGPD